MSYPSADTAHPLALELISLAAERSLAGPAVEVGCGSGRNTRALVAARIPVVPLADDVPVTQLPGSRDQYGAALSTHAYLHGTADKLRIAFAELRRVLTPGAPVFVTLGSIRDARYGFGIPYDERSFAPGDGDEAGIPHAYFDRDGVGELLEGLVTITSAEEVDVDAIVGRWAHPDAGEGEDPGGRVHWFVRGLRQ